MTIKPDLSAHTALVTGAARGIGAAIAIALAEAGAAVAINYRERADDAASVVAKIKSMGGRAVAVAADVSQAAAVAKMMEPPFDPRPSHVRAVRGGQSLEDSRQRSTQ